MVTRELTERFYQTYRENYDLVNEWNEKLLGVQGEEAWVKIIVERSGVIRHAFAENEKVYKELTDAMPDPLDEEPARRPAAGRRRAGCSALSSGLRTDE